MVRMFHPASPKNLGYLSSTFHAKILVVSNGLKSLVYLSDCGEEERKAYTSARPKKTPNVAAVRKNALKILGGA